MICCVQFELKTRCFFCLLSDCYKGKLLHFHLCHISWLGWLTAQKECLPASSVICVTSIEARQHVVAGRPIVGDSWVNACGRSGSFVDPVDHLLIDSAAHKKFGFDMRTSYERAQHHLLLKGLHVFFTPGTLLLETFLDSS